MSENFDTLLFSSRASVEACTVSWFNQILIVLKITNDSSVPAKRVYTFIYNQVHSMNEFFIPALSSRLSLKFKWQQVFWDLESCSCSYQYCGQGILDISFDLPVSFPSFLGLFQPTSNKWHRRRLYVRRLVLAL